jgi:hypothetical protein
MPTKWVDFVPKVPRGRFGFPDESAVFLHRLFVQPVGNSLTWEAPLGLIDFHAEELWQRMHLKAVAAE